MFLRLWIIASLLAELVVAGAASDLGKSDSTQIGCKEEWINYCRDFREHCQKHCVTEPTHESCCGLAQAVGATKASETGEIPSTTFLARKPSETGETDGVKPGLAWQVAIGLGIAIACVVTTLVASMLMWHFLGGRSAKVSPSHQASTGIPTIHIDPPKFDVCSVSGVEVPSDASTMSPPPSTAPSASSTSRRGSSAGSTDSACTASAHGSPRPAPRIVMGPLLDVDCLAYCRGRAEVDRHSRKTRSRSAPSSTASRSPR